MKNDPLFELIQGLSGAEKRYFRLSATQFVHEKPSLLLGLFTYYESCENPEPGADETWFREHSKSTQFAAIRHALLGQVLESLRRFHEKRIPNAGFRRELDYIALLFDRGQLSLCSRLLKQARKKADDLDSPEMKVELIRWEVRLLRRNPGTNLRYRLAALNREEQAAIVSLQAGSALRFLHDEVYDLYVSSQRKKPASSVIRRFREHPALGLPEQRLPFELQIIRLYVLTFLAQIERKPEEAKAAFEEMIQVWKRYPRRIQQEPLRYLRTLRSYADACLELGQPALIASLPDEMERLIRLKKMDPIQQLQLSDYLRLRALALPEYLLRKPADLPAILQRFEAHQQALNLTTRIVFWFNFSTLYFLLGEFSSSLRWTVEILNLPGTEARRDILHFARLLHLMIQFELGNSAILEDLLRSSSRFLRQQKAEAVREKLLFTGLRKILNAPQDDHAGIFGDLFTALREIRQERSNETGKGELEAWVYAHAKGMNIREAYIRLHKSGAAKLLQS